MAEQKRDYYEVLGIDKRCYSWNYHSKNKQYDNNG